MKHNALSALRAKSFEPGMYGDGRGLWLIKRTKARGKWVLRLFVYGKRRDMGLGRWPDVSISEARTHAELARKTLRDGSDPLFERVRIKRAGRPLTVKEAVAGCFEARKAELKGDGEAGRWMSPINVHVIPEIGNYPIEKVDQHVLHSLLEPLWHTKPEAALKALQRMSLTFKHAAALGLAVDLQATMKTRALLGKQRRVKEHIPSLPYAHAPAFYASLLKTDAVSALALRFLLLTLGRTTEVRLASVPEIEGDVWNLSAERTKTNTARRIPLVKSALQVVEKAREVSPNDFLFPAFKGQPISDMAMAKLMKDRGLAARPHGFRATFRTWAEEQTDAPFELKEAVLGHVVDTGVVAAYQRSDRFEKRRALMEEWEKFLTTP